MNKNFHILILIFLAISSVAQVSKFPDGVYLSLDQLKSLKPAFNADFQISKSVNSYTGLTGSDDYELRSKIDSLDRKYIRKKIVAYKKNDSLFLNCYQQKLGSWYALCLTEGNFLTFVAGMSSAKTSEETALYGFMFGAIGSGIAGANAAKKRFLYVLSLRTGNARLLKKEYLEERLKENQNLLDQFTIEKEKDSASVLIKYINLLNGIVLINSGGPVQPK